MATHPRKLREMRRSSLQPTCACSQSAEKCQQHERNTDTRGINPSAGRCCDQQSINAPIAKPPAEDNAAERRDEASRRYQVHRWHVRPRRRAPSVAEQPFPREKDRAAGDVDCRQLLMFALIGLSLVPCAQYPDRHVRCLAANGQKTYSPAAIDMAPATSPAIPAIKRLRCVACAAATPSTRLDVERMPSFAPRTVARSQPMRPV